MLTVVRRLPQFRAASTPMADREFRWALTVLIQQRVARAQLGSFFESVSVLKSDQAGVPLELGFRFRGSNRHGPERDVTDLLRDLEAEARAGCAKS
jgi:hypothetical protein